MTVANIARYLIKPFRRVAAAQSALSQPDYIQTPDNGGFFIPGKFNQIDIDALRRGEYEYAETQILRRHFRPDHTIIEIGANIGYVSRFACDKKLESGGTYVAIEANSLSIPSLKRNLGDSFIGRNIHIMPAAIGIPVTKEGELQNFVPRNNLSSGLENVLKTGMFESTIGVPVRSLSSVVREFDTARRGYSLICDAEGAEILILEKDPQSFDTCHQVAIELHHPDLTGSNVTPQHMVRMFEQLGFKHECRMQDTHYFARPDL